ncbi:glycosyltransferase [Ornithinimicrobium pekingense]|uniref:Glycosyl transferase group 1 n=1 Tax=Ornithinimicrobium pekingense TaxID=384677 RepID=A0ABQ2FAX9_9MICO|nr:glycosyltransferase [Ornithinimicrobium pekingense]GGK71134.1 glycosyl transferase group 1 [Ornithinimicrobium pekingense]
MKVLLLTNIYPPRSTPQGATFIRSRVRALEGHGVTVVPVAVWSSWTPAATALRTALRRRDDEAPAPPFLSATAPFGLEHALRRRLASRSARRWLERVTEAVLEHVPGGADVVHAHGMYDLPAGLVARSVAQRLGVPYAVTLHGTDVNLLMPRRAKLYAGVLREACATIYVSAALQRDAQGLAPDQRRAHVIPNGVDPSLFRPGTRAPEPSVLYAGNLETVKGADRLPAIWRAVRSAVPTARLVVAGSGSWLGKARQELDDPSVDLLGRVDQTEVARQMARAHVVILPSRAEGWPTVIMEAYASGTPVVATAVGGTPEAVVDADRLVPGGPGLETRFAQAVTDVLQEAEGPRLDLVELAGRHDWVQVAAQEIEVLRSC